MKAGVSSPNGLELRDIAQPVPKPNEVLTRVKACGLNRADLSAAKASLGHGVMGAALGLEWAGEVAAVGSDVKEFKAGGVSLFDLPRLGGQNFAHGFTASIVTGTLSHQPHSLAE